MNLHSLTESDLRQFADNLAIYYRGEDCYESGVIYQFELSEAGIRARVRGNYGNYKIKIDHTAEEVEAQCNCPYDGYICKHIIAVLLHYLRTTHAPIEPPQMSGITMLEHALRELTQPQLLDLVMGLARQKAEVRRSLLVAMPIASHLLRQQLRDPLRVQHLQEQIDQGLLELKYQSEYSDYYYDREYADDEPNPALESALEEAKMLHPADQLEVFWHAITAANQLFNTVPINTAPIATALQLYGRAVTQLELTPTTKQSYFNALLAAFDWEMCTQGNLTAAIKSALDCICTVPEDYRYLIEQFEAKETEAIDWIAGYYLQLGDDENYLRVRQGHLGQEAQYLELADFWQRRGAVDQTLATLEAGAIYLVETRYQPPSGQPYLIVPKSSQLFERLAAYYHEAADPENLCRVLVMTIDYCGVTLPLYQQVEALASQLGQWATLRPELLKLARFNREVLAKIYLYEQNWQAALELAHQKSAYEPLRVLVADGVKFHHPEAAISIYKELVQAHLDRQDRKSHTIIASYIRAMRAIYLTVLQDEVLWQGYLRDLRDRHRRYPALQHELKRL
jgi:SWIM zinc finger